MTSVDRRILRTRRLLAEALVALVNERHYEEITIRDITDQADVGYATFFRHYDGKDDLMLEIFTGIVEELESLPERHGQRFFEQEGYLLFEHVAKNQALYRSILDSLPFARRLREHLVGMILPHLESHSEEVPDPMIPLGVAAQHIVSSLLGIIDWWLANDQPYAIERMALIYDRLLIRASWHAIISQDSIPLPWEAQGR